MSAGSQVDDVAVVIPARNEADRIRQTVAAAAGLPGVGLVVVVDDGSSDGTGAVARGAGAVLLRHTRNRGKAAARKRSPAEEARKPQRGQERNIPHRSPLRIRRRHGISRTESLPQVTKEPAILFSCVRLLKRKTQQGGARCTMFMAF